MKIQKKKKKEKIEIKRIKKQSKLNLSIQSAISVFLLSEFARFICRYFAINIKSQSHYDAKIFVLSSVGTHEWDRQ
jgi:hypothetical protein